MAGLGPTIHKEVSGRPSVMAKAANDYGSSTD